MRVVRWALCASVWMVFCLGTASVGAQDTADCMAGTRALVHDLGTTCVPENPLRVAVVEYDAQGLMFVLGIQPAAHVQTFVDSYRPGLPPEAATRLDAWAADSVDVGFPPNLEALLGVQPDLILVTTGDSYDQLSAIAPTVAFDIYQTDSETWSDTMVYWANALNVTDEAAAYVDAVNARLALLGERVPDATTASVVALNPTNGSTLIGPPNYIYNLLMNQAGIARPGNQGLSLADWRATIGDPVWQEVSEEQLNEVDADVLLPGHVGVQRRLGRLHRAGEHRPTVGHAARSAERARLRGGRRTVD